MIERLFPSITTGLIKTSSGFMSFTHEKELIILKNPFIFTLFFIIEFISLIAILFGVVVLITFLVSAINFKLLEKIFLLGIVILIFISSRLINLYFSVKVSKLELNQSFNYLYLKSKSGLVSAAALKDSQINIKPKKVSFIVNKVFFEVYLDSFKEEDKKILLDYLQKKT